DLQDFKNQLADEIADMWHFLLSLTIQAGLQPTDIMNAYEKKWQVNFERQNNPALGYVEKDNE
ncbi:MAG: dUTPase, partial [Promethearchaeota archaeon]